MENKNLFRKKVFKTYSFFDNNVENILQDINSEINIPFCSRKDYKESSSLIEVSTFFFKINGILNWYEEYIFMHSKTIVFYNRNCNFDINQKLNTIDIKNIDDILSLKKQKNHLFLLKKDKREQICQVILNFFYTHKNLSNKIKMEILSAFIFLSTEFIDTINSIDMERIPPKIFWEEFLNFNINKKKKEYETPESYFYIFEILHQIGFDIIIFNPYGISTIENYVDLPVINLDENKMIKHKLDGCDIFSIVMGIMILVVFICGTIIAIRALFLGAVKESSFCLSLEIFIISCLIIAMIKY